MGTITHVNYTKVCKSIIKTKIKRQKTQKNIDKDMYLCAFVKKIKTQEQKDIKLTQ